MHILPFLLMAILLPAPLKSHIEKTLAARRADPKHWQTTPLPPIPIGIVGMTSERVRSAQEDMDKLIEDFIRKNPTLRGREAELKKELQKMQPTKP
jgi:hypothetical protein